MRPARSTPMRMAVCGLGLLLATLPAGPASAAVLPLTTLSVPSSVPADCNGASADATLSRNAEVHPWVAANPSNPMQLAANWQQGRWSLASQLVDSSYSTDGGGTWQRPLAPPTFSRCAGGNAANGGDWERATDPSVSISPDDTVFQTAMTINLEDWEDEPRPATGILVSKSEDKGRTWGKVTTLASAGPGEIFHDYPLVTADPYDSRLAYVVWDRFYLKPDGEFGGPTMISRTSDGGKTWSAPAVIYDGGPWRQTIGNSVVVLPGGKLVLAAVEFRADPATDSETAHLVAMTSNDHGRTWSKAVDVTNGPIPGTELVVKDPFDQTTLPTGIPMLTVAADPRPGTSNVYVGWTDTRFTDNAHSQIAVARSTDGGVTWDAPVRASANTNTQAFLPAIAVNAVGTVGVGYYDLTHDDPTQEPLETDVWLTASSDDGRSFDSPQRLTRKSFDYRLATTARGGFYLGDHFGLVADAGNGFHAVFPVTTNATDRSDIVTTRVSI
jgi:hypothetical protein